MDVSEELLPVQPLRIPQNKYICEYTSTTDAIANSVVHENKDCHDRWVKPIFDRREMEKQQLERYTCKSSPECSTSTETESDEEDGNVLQHKRDFRFRFSSSFECTKHSLDSQQSSSFLENAEQDEKCLMNCSYTQSVPNSMSLLETSPLIHFQSKDSFRDKSIRYEFSQLIRLSAPVIATYLLEFLPGVISMLLVGHLPSSKSRENLDGVSLSLMFMNLTAIPFGFGLATALDTLCSQAYGAQKSHRMGIYLQTGMLLLGLILIPVLVLNYYTTFWLLLLRQPASVAELAGEFSRILLPSLPFLYMYELMKKLLQAQHIVAPMVYIAVISNVAHLILGIYGTQFMLLGYAGAAVARTLSTMLLPLCLIPYFIWYPKKLHCWWAGWNFAEAMHQVRPFLALGIPGMFMILMEWWSFEMMAIFVGLLPNSISAISVHSVLVNVSTLTFNVFFGISVACNVQVGNCLGRNDAMRSKRISIIALLFSLAVSLLLALVLFVSRAYIPTLFINDVSIADITSHSILVLLPYQLCDALNAVLQGIFRGIGQQYYGATLNFVVYFIVGIPCGIYFAFTLSYGVEGLWTGLTIGIFVGVVLASIKLYRMDWRALRDISCTH